MDDDLRATAHSEERREAAEALRATANSEDLLHVAAPGAGRSVVVRSLLGTDPLDATLESASPSPFQGSIWH